MYQLRVIVTSLQVLFPALLKQVVVTLGKYFLRKQPKMILCPVIHKCFCLGSRDTLEERATINHMAGAGHANKWPKINSSS